jgi:Lrp/AsnC family transcriptional regulator for asnA, asnC and gidA
MITKNLDDRSRYIISELTRDGRTKYTKMARDLKITPAAVKERVERLIDKGFIRVAALVNMQKFFPITAVIGIEADSDAIKILTRRFRNCPLVFHMAKTSGMHNLIIFIAAEDLNFIDKFISSHVRSEPGVRHVEVNIGNSPSNPEFLQLNVCSPKLLDACPCGARCDDCAFYTEHSCMGCPVTKFHK